MLALTPPHFGKHLLAEGTANFGNQIKTHSNGNSKKGITYYHEKDKNNPL